MRGAHPLVRAPWVQAPHRVAQARSAPTWARLQSWAGRCGCPRPSAGCSTCWRCRAPAWTCWPASPRTLRRAGPFPRLARSDSSASRVHGRRSLTWQPAAQAAAPDSPRPAATTKAAAASRSSCAASVDVPWPRALPRCVQIHVLPMGAGLTPESLTEKVAKSKHWDHVCAFRPTGAPGCNRS